MSGIRLGPGEGSGIDGLAKENDGASIDLLVGPPNNEHEPRGAPDSLLSLAPIPTKEVLDEEGREAAPCPKVGGLLEPPKRDEGGTDTVLLPSPENKGDCLSHSEVSSAGSGAPFLFSLSNGFSASLIGLEKKLRPGAVASVVGSAETSTGGTGVGAVTGRENGGVATARGLENADDEAKKFGIPSPPLEVVSDVSATGLTAGRGSDERSLSAVGNPNGVPNTEVGAEVLPFVGPRENAKTGAGVSTLGFSTAVAGAMEGAPVNEKGREEMGGSLALVVSCSIGFI